MPFVLVPHDLAPDSDATAVVCALGSTAEGVLTVLPAPFGGVNAESVREAGEGSPSFSRFVESSRWASPLWRSGVLKPAYSGYDLAHALSRTSTTLQEDDLLRPIHGCLRPERLLEESEGLEWFCRDLLTGGGNPTVSLPLLCLLERLAHDRAAALVCGERSGRAWPTRPTAAPLFSLTIPVLKGPSVDGALRFYDGLREGVDPLREAIEDATRSVHRSAYEYERDLLQLPARAYRECFEEAWMARSEAIDDEAAGLRPALVVLSGHVARVGSAVRSAASRLGALERSSVGSPRGRRAASAAIVPDSGEFLLIRVRRAPWDFGSSGQD